MASPRSILSVLIILSAVTLIAFVIAALVLPGFTRLLPWAGFVAGLIALLQSLSLSEAVQKVRSWLALAGLATMLLMLVLILWF
jgi:hypothetical protein